MDALDQIGIDNKMIALDGTKNKARLGETQFYRVYGGRQKQAANAVRLPLFKYLGGFYARTLPLPMMNIVNGGAHSDAPIDIQEFMIVPKARAPCAKPSKWERRFSTRSRKFLKRAASRRGSRR